MLVLAVVGAAVGALGVAALLRRWIGTLERGAIIRAGWFEVAAVALAAVGMVAGWDRPQLALVLWIGVLAVPLAAIDLRHHRLPDAITVPAVPVTAAVIGLTELADPAAGELLRAGLGALALAGGLFALAWIAPDAMGLGDVKLAVSLGMALGYLSWSAVVLGLFLAFLAGALVTVAGMLLGRLTLRSPVPFGPSLLAGCWLALVLPSLTSGLH